MDQNTRPADMQRINNPELANAFIDEQVQAIRDQVGDGKVLLALSGGVDSSVVAALIDRAIGENLICVHVNHGLMRKGESEQVIDVFQNQMDANLVYVDATDRFLDLLADVDEPETKRKIIGGEFIRVFEEEARKVGDEVDFLAQGTIYPDILESQDGVKAHHNVGGLPDDLQFELVEPVKLLFKDEVRVVGRELGLPENMVERQPFPGPGLAIRILGEVTKEKADRLRQADFIFREELAGAVDGVKNAQDQLLSGDPDQQQAALDGLKNSVSQMEGASGGVSAAAEALDEFRTALGGSGSLSETLGGLLDQLRDASDSAAGIGTLLRQSAEAISGAVSDLTSQGSVQFTALGGQFRQSGTGLINALGGLSSEMERLNSSAKAGTDALIEDLRLINSQFRMVVEVMMDAMEELIQQQQTAEKADQKMTQRINKVLEAARSLSEELHRKVTVEELMAESGLSRKAIEDAIRMSGDKIEAIAIGVTS